jgi:nucleotide-binding universal stress UspA family protein
MRVILVPLLGDDDDGVGLAAAYAVAGPFRAHIDGMFMRPDPVEAIMSLEGEATAELIGNVTRASTATWDARSKLAKEVFDAARAAADAALADQPTGTDSVTAGWREVTGGAEAVLPAEGRLSDLIVFGGIHSGGSAHRRRMFEVALMHATRPLLLVPEKAPEAIGPEAISPKAIGPKAIGPKAIGKVIALAWNGSAEAARAVAGALPLLHNAEQVHILTAASPRTDVERADGLARYFGWQGLSCERHAMYPSNQVGAALLTKARELRADLLVMGGYGRSRVSELVFGGVTRTVLGQYHLPILLAH